MFSAYSLTPTGVHVGEGGQTSTGSVVNWLRRELLGGGVEYDVLNAEAGAVPPGCEGLTCLDHFQVRLEPLPSEHQLQCTMVSDKNTLAGLEPAKCCAQRTKACLVG